MRAKTWTLTDTERDVYLDTFAIGPEDVEGSPPGWSVTKRRLRGGRQDGVDVVEVDNGHFRFTVIPTRGMSIWRGWIGEATLGWQSPVRGPVHPRFVPLAEPSGLGWLDGFDELLVRCGLESNGAPDFDEHGRLVYPLHGRIANLPAHFVEVGFEPAKNEISVTGVVEESRFHFQKLRLAATVKTRLGQSGFEIHDEVTNYSGSSTKIQMLYHVNFGSPLLDAGSKLLVPIEALAPRNEHAADGMDDWDVYHAPRAASEEQVYYFRLVGDNDGNTRTLLRNSDATQGVSLHFNKNHLPCFALWKNTTADEDGYVTGLEPGTNFPNPRSFEMEQGRVVELASGSKQLFNIGLEWHTDEESVAEAEKLVAGLQVGTEPDVYDKPQKGWCPP